MAAQQNTTFHSKCGQVTKLQPMGQVGCHTLLLPDSFLVPLACHCWLEKKVVVGAAATPSDRSLHSEDSRAIGQQESRFLYQP